MIPKNGQVWRHRRSGREIVVLDEVYEDVFVRWHYADEPISNWHYSDVHGFLWDGHEHVFVRESNAS